MASKRLPVFCLPRRGNLKPLFHSFVSFLLWHCRVSFLLNCCDADDYVSRRRRIRAPIQILVDCETADYSDIVANESTDIAKNSMLAINRGQIARSETLPRHRLFPGLFAYYFGASTIDIVRPLSIPAGFSTFATSSRSSSTWVSNSRPRSW